MNKIILELRKVTDNIRNRVIDNLQKANEEFMRFMHLYQNNMEKFDSTNIFPMKTQLANLIDKLDVYRIPPILLTKQKKKENFLNQIKIVIFYSNLLLIESENILSYFSGTNSKNEVSKFNAEKFLNGWTIYHQRILELISQLENFDTSWFKQDIFDVIYQNVKPLYTNSRNIKKILELSKKIKIYELEMREYNDLLKQKNNKKLFFELKNENHIEQPPQTDSYERSIISKVFRRLFSNTLRDEIVEKVNFLSDEKIVQEKGGMISISELHNLLVNRYDDLEFTIKDLDNALEYMKKNNFIHDIETVNNLELIKFIPIELSKDPKTIFESVSVRGVETKETLLKKLDWSESRLNIVLDYLIDQNLCKVKKDPLGGTKYYFPGLY